MHHDYLIGKHIDDFVIEERIGKGGMSTVYRAFQPSINRQVALKVITLSPELNEQGEFQRRFAQEAAMIAKLEHIHILPIYDYGVNNEIAYLAMRLLRGGSLGSLLNDGPLPLDRVADLFGQVARGLAYAHHKNVIHRDIKPSNILLDDSGNAYVTDFGLAKMVGESMDLTKPGNIVGTPAYMSPEQLRGEVIDHRADIYSLGVVLYHMLTGRPPFEATDTNIISVIYQHLEKIPAPPSEFIPEIPVDVELVVMRALEKDPRDRFDSAEEMANELDVSLGRKGSTSSYPAAKPVSRPSSPNYLTLRGRQQKRRRRSLLMGALAVLIVALGIGIFGFTQLNRTPVFKPATVIAGAVAVAEESAPTAEEVHLARGRMGANGFIAYITCNQTSEYHATQAREMGDFAGEYELDYRIYDSDNDKSMQIPQIERARADGASLLIICPLDVTTLEATLRSAQNAGMPMVFMATGIPSYGGVIMAGDNYKMGLEAGRLAGQLIAEEMDGAANVVVLEYPDLPAIVTRATGIEAGLVEFAPRARIVARVLGATNEFGYESIKTLIEDGVDFDVIVSINDAGSFGAIKALEEADISPDDVMITSVDAEALARQYIRQGYYMRGSVDVGRELFSHTAIDAAVKLLAGSTVPETYLVPPSGIITRDNIDG